MEPKTTSGVGGFGLILVYDAKQGRVRALKTHASGRIPKSLDPRAFRPPTSNYLENRRGAKTTVAPVNARAWKELSANYGSLPWASLFESAVDAAEHGFALQRFCPQECMINSRTCPGDLRPERKGRWPKASAW